MYVNSTSSCFSDEYSGSLCTQDISRFEVRVNVVHFKTPASIPVPSESIATIVPVVIANEGAKIAGQALTEGKYWQITKEEEAEPDFYAVLVLYRKI